MADVSEAADERLAFNGVDADTGQYLFGPMPVAALADRVRGTEPEKGRHLKELQRRSNEDEEDWGLTHGRDPEDLASAGWALITAEGTDPQVLEALEPLRQLREKQAGDLYQEFTVEPGEDDDQFRARHHMGPGPVDPRRIPYYLLLVGGPDQIPFSFQYQLDVSYAVGRVHFDTPAEYASYAESVVAAEHDITVTTEESRRPQVHLFAARNPGDTSTALSATRLVEPLRAELTEYAQGVGITADIGESATKSRLGDLLLDGSAPEVLFTATHGLGSLADSRRETQGALLCQDWQGPMRKPTKPTNDQYLAGVDIPTDRPVTPRIVFSFSCYGAGTPAMTDFPTSAAGQGPAGAETPFVARLPQRLLGDPAGGALAFVGHVDRAWSCSFLWDGLVPQVAAMTSTLLAILEGLRVGDAMEYLNSRYAEIATELMAKVDAIRQVGLVVQDRDLAGLWTAHHDARNYILLGDPAVRGVQMAGSEQGGRHVP